MQIMSCTDEGIYQNAAVCLMQEPQEEINAVFDVCVYEAVHGGHGVMYSGRYTRFCKCVKLQCS